MYRTPLFLALTRPVQIAGLPMNYVIVLAVIVIVGFVATSSFLWLVSSGGIGYVGLRILASYDPLFIDVLMNVVRTNPVSPDYFKSGRIRYRA